jgi:hypothetical protein
MVRSETEIASELDLIQKQLLALIHLNDPVLVSDQLADIKRRLSALADENEQVRKRLAHILQVPPRR